MKFEAYNYQCSPAKWDGGFFTEEAKQYREESLVAMDKHLVIIDRLLTQERVEYPVAAEMPLPFKEGDTLRLLRLNARKRKNLPAADESELTRPYLVAKMLYAHSGFYVMTLQNRTMITREIDWQKIHLVNMPSCIVIIANTEGRQLLMVESNGAFSRTGIVAKIFQDTLHALLLPEKLNIDFKAHYDSSTFVQHLESKLQKGVSLKWLKFHFDYPNMADDAKLLAGYFEEFGMEMNAEMDYTLKGQHKQPLNVDTKNMSPHLNSIISYAGKTGNTLVSAYSDNSRQEFDAKNLGISTLVAEESMRKKIMAMVEEAVADKVSSFLSLARDNGDFRDVLARWLRGIDNSRAVI